MTTVEASLDEEHVRRIVDAAPALTADQKQRLAGILLAPVVGGGDDAQR